jgi:SAM-dependent methyltransferase
MLTVRYETLRLSSGETVLDLGCGGGRHTYEALRRGAHAVAADLDGAALKDVKAWAEAMLEVESLPEEATATCVSADALGLPFADASFDRIIVSEVFEHVPLDERAMSEVRRVLKPGGRAAVTVPRWWPEIVCWILSREYHSNEGGHVRIYRRRQLIRRLRKAGLYAFEAHHAHAIHAPYWWLKCLVGVRREEAFLPSLYHRFLVWEMTSTRGWVRSFERLLNPFMGKSLVLYLEPGEPR